MSPEVIVCADTDALARRGCKIVVADAEEAIAARGVFRVALSGGSTPAALYKMLADPEGPAALLDEDRTQFFFGDERVVPFTSPDSNGGMARTALFKKKRFPDDAFFAVPTGKRTRDEAAQEYTKILAEAFGLRPNGPAPPEFDLVFMGLGEDGHTASLFPHNASLSVTDKWIVGSPPGTLPPPVDRITLTFPVFNVARHTLFLVAGEKKAEIVHHILRDNPPVEEAPTAGIRPANGRVTWLLDKAAARLL